MEVDSGATSTANWWAHATRQTRAATHRKTKLAAALGLERFDPVRVALAEGRLLVDQAQVIVTAVEALPADLDPQVTADAVATLVGYAADHDAKALRILGRRILEVVAPEVGQAHEAQVLEREERDAEAAAVLRMHEDGHGKAHGRFTVPDPYRGDAGEGAARDRRPPAPRGCGGPGTRVRPPLGTQDGPGVL